MSVTSHLVCNYMEKPGLGDDRPRAGRAHNYTTLEF